MDVTEAKGATVAKTDPAQVAETWKNRLSAATTEIQNGVNRVTTAPGQQAAAKRDLWLARLQASQAKWARNVAAVPLDEWKNKMLTVGVPRIAQGAAANEHKMQDFMSEFLPFVNGVAQKVRSMPKSTLEDSIARATTQIRETAKFQRTRR